MCVEFELVYTWIDKWLSIFEVISSRIDLVILKPWAAAIFSRYAACHFMSTHIPNKYIFLHFLCRPFLAKWFGLILINYSRLKFCNPIFCFFIALFSNTSRKLYSSRKCCNLNMISIFSAAAAYETSNKTLDFIDWKHVEHMQSRDKKGSDRRRRDGKFKQMVP